MLAITPRYTLFNEQVTNQHIDNINICTICLGYSCQLKWYCTQDYLTLNDGYLPCSNEYL